MEYKPTIGLEIHVELKTKTKMFCRCLNNTDETRPNVNICPVCMAHPGTLPVLNLEAIKHVLRVGKALGSKLADFTEWDRKNYFYPDIPKGYQISQYKFPLVEGGTLAGVDITRVHLEEDTARSQHVGNDSLIDYNRAGVPLMELVTEPVITSSKQAGDFARELQLLIGPEYLHISEANMEKGEMRVEANISLNMGTKVEVKNLNTISGMEKAIDFELKRQQELVEHGDRVVQETRGWDENAGKTFSQRKKESSHDYRYFPDPDLPKLYVSQIPELQNFDLPELPWQKRKRLADEFGIKQSDIEIFVSDRIVGALFEDTMKVLSDKKFAQLTANYLTSDLAGLRKNMSEIKMPEPTSFAELINMAEGGEISSRGAKDILAVLVTEGGNPKAIAESKGLFQKSDEGALAAIVDQVITENPKVVEDYKAGNERLIQFLIGQAMKLSKGSANPAVLTKMFKEKLS
ncbi:MAG: Asp-tRNA(Asn)/Glu-tRNA(Gln) amidotransferase subunit GatB [Candidatus Vogelbacteria bacterium]|nr:Asp-tRNA(Asn)/Glu-tRNA(Gln) amidotransferase subunit GatB [Candidatus Vogelbacteria bacterium]